MAAAGSNLAFNRNFVKEYMDMYSKKFDVAHTRCISAFFHPSMKDHVITLNQVNFPDPKKNAIDTLVLDDIFMDGVQEIQEFIKRDKENKRNTEESLTLDKTQSTLLPPIKNHRGMIPLDDVAESSSEYEGGRGLLKIVKSRSTAPPKRNIKLHQNVMKFISTKTKKKRHRRMSQVQRSTPLKSTDLNQDINQFYDALDKYFYRKVLKTYEIYQQAEKIPIDETQSPKKNPLYKYKKLEIANDCIQPLEEGNGIFNFGKMPAIDGKKYIPQPFRHKYEMCIWKIGVHNTTKVKQIYFTPKNIIENPNGVYHVRLEKTFDSGVIMLTCQENSEPTMMVQILDSKLFELLYEINVVISNKEVSKADKKKLSSISVISKLARLTSSCKALNSIPKTFVWGNGRYLTTAVCGIINYDSIFEFKTYDFKKQKQVGTFSRSQSDNITKHLLIDIICFNKKIVMVFQKRSKYYIVEVDLINDAYDKDRVFTIE